MAASSQKRHSILFVDDEEGVRLTLPVVLERRGFEVHAAATIEEALAEINSRRYDVLLCDLNIEKPGDGFLIITAMRHLQPGCVTLLLTGYPSLETALEAIRAQVDDYFIKPADTETLVGAITKKLQSRPPEHGKQMNRLFTILRENVAPVTADILARMKSDPATAAVPLSDEERVDHLPTIFRALVEQLENNRDQISKEALEFSLAHGKKRREQGYDLRMALRDFHLVEEAVDDFLRHNFLPQWSAESFADLARLTKSLHVLTLESAKAYQVAPPAARSLHRKRGAS